MWPCPPPGALLYEGAEPTPLTSCVGGWLLYCWHHLGSPGGGISSSPCFSQVISSCPHPHFLVRALRVRRTPAQWAATLALCSGGNCLGPPTRLSSRAVTGERPEMVNVPHCLGAQRDAFGKRALPGKSSGEQVPSPPKPLQMAHPGHRHVRGVLFNRSVMSDSL